MNVEFRKSLRRKKTSAAPPPSVERDVNAEINLKGWLYRLEGSPLKHWKKRWCVLAQYALFVYKEEDEQKLLTSILLPGYSVRVCTSHDRVSHKNAFVAEHDTLKSFYLAADSNAAMCQWRNSMAQAATVQAQIPPEPPQPVYEHDYGRYVDMNSLTCVTRSPIYANAPPKPKRLSPRDNRPRSADFLSHPEQRSDGLCPPRSEPNVRPHTSMRLFDPICETNNNNNYCPSFDQNPPPPREMMPPMPHSRPRSCLAEPLSGPPQGLPTSHAAFLAGQQQRMYPHSPHPFGEKPQDIYGSLQPHCLPYSLACQNTLEESSATLQSRRFSRTSTSASSTPPLGIPISNQGALHPAAFRAHSLHNMTSLRNTLEVHRPQQNGMNGYASSTTSLKGNVLSEASSYSYDALDSRSGFPMRNTPPNGLVRPTEKYLYNSMPAVEQRQVSRPPNMNPQYPTKKAASSRTLSTASCGSASIIEDIQPSKLEVYRQVPQPSYFTRPATEFMSNSQTNRPATDAMNDRRDSSLQSASSRDLQSLQSLTDSQYSTAPPESSLPSLESNSSDIHAPSPVQHFTNLPPFQLRQRDVAHKVFEPRAAPPKYSEACLRSEIIQQKSTSKDQLHQLVARTPQVSPPVPQLQQDPATNPSTPRIIPNSRKLLFDQNGLSPMKTPLIEKNAPEDPYSYGRDDLRKASQLFYNGRLIGSSAQMINPEYRSAPTLDLSFQSSSHSSVFEHDTLTDRQPHHNDTAVADQQRPRNLVHQESSNYAIRKQEIEGAKVIASRVDVAPSRGPRSSDSVTSTTSRDSQNPHEKPSTTYSPDRRPSPESSASDLQKEMTTRRPGIVSEKLAFFESKKSSESLRPKSAMSNGSPGTSATGRPVPDLLDELRESDSTSGSRMAASHYVCSASSDDILRTITSNKQHQRSLSLLDRPAPDVVPTQSPPYYYSDLSLSAQNSISRDETKAASSTGCIVPSGQPKGPSTEQQHRTKWHSQEKPKLTQNGRDHQKLPLANASTTKKKQSWSCDNLLRNQLLKVPEITQSATCLLESEPFYENIGFGSKTAGKTGPEPQAAKAAFLAAESAETPKNAMVSVDQISSTSPPKRAPCEISEPSRQRRSQTDAEARPSDEQESSLTSSGPPDLIQSALNSSGDVGEQGDEIFAQILNSISCPSKIDIPERYVPESDSEADSSAVERLNRYHKADSIQRRLVGQLRNDGSRLSMNQVIAKQAKHARKILASQH